MKLTPLFFTRHRAFAKHRARGFTLIEVLVSSVLIVMIMAMLFGTVDNTQKLLQRTTSQISQFQSARNGFESMTRRLSQATLNTYWRAQDPKGAKSSEKGADYLFRRQSEMQFLCGPSAKIFTSPSGEFMPQNEQAAFPGHGVFFQAPLGFTETPEDFRTADTMLNACGYFVAYGDDPGRPAFLKSLNLPSRYRFRLMELNIPGEKLTIFNRPKDTDGKSPATYKGKPQILDHNENGYLGLTKTSRLLNESWVRPFWTKSAFEREAINHNTEGDGRFKYSRVLAENVVALIVLPKLAESDRSTPDRIDELAPEYAYDSWRLLTNSTNKLEDAERDNLLPSVVQVTMVAMDEPSALKNNLTKSSLPDWTNGLFQKTNGKNYTNDIATLEQRINSHTPKVNYRIFTTDVVIRGAKWSRDPAE